MHACYRSQNTLETTKVSTDSPSDGMTGKTRDEVSGKPGRQKAEKTRRRQTGDVHYLEQARRILAEIRALCIADAMEDESHAWTLTSDERESALDQNLTALCDRIGKIADH